MSGTPTTLATERPSGDDRPRSPGIAMPWLGARRAVLAGLVLASTVFGVALMHQVLAAGGYTLPRAAILVLFAITFGWLTVSFWTAVAGFVLQLLHLDPLTLRRLPSVAVRRPPPTARTAIVMPAYNEDTARLFAGVEATWRSLQRAGGGSAFDFHLLSDTTCKGLARAEQAEWARLTEALGRPPNLHYRRRSDNTGKKVGNIAEFCERCGDDYDYMIVLDADSIMSGDSLLELVHRMDANPGVGLIQTAPLPVRQDTFFGRCLQFAAHLHGPMASTGLAFWQGDCANYWGHNAIIRVQPFMRHCQLPVLSGRPPLGGEILSHDFVEAAMLRRAGWQVVLAADIGGSYEELPGNLNDYCARDRRWAQGNLQHLRLLAMPGLHPVSRVNFLLGAGGYLMSLFWLLLLAFGTFDAVWHAQHTPQYFASGSQLFPDWPVVLVTLIYTLLVSTVVLLLLPKLLALVLALLYRRRAFGGGAALVAGSVVEIVFTALLAPLMMMYHSLFVAAVLAGRPVRWSAQSREGRTLSWREASRTTFSLMVIGMLWATLVRHHSPLLFWWLSPVLFGLMLSPALVGYSSSRVLGQRLRRIGLLTAPCEGRSFRGVVAAVGHCLGEPPPVAAAGVMRPALRFLGGPEARDESADAGLAGEMHARAAWRVPWPRVRETLERFPALAVPARSLPPGGMRRESRRRR